MLKKSFTKILSNTLKTSSLVLSGALLFSTASAEITYQQDFEKGGKFEQKAPGKYFWDGLKNSLNYPTIKQAPQRSGKAGNFYLHKKGTGTTLGGTYRTEAYLIDGKGSFDFGKEYWITMDYFYKDWITDPDGGEIGPLQVHSKPGSWDTECRLHSAHSTAPFLMTTGEGKASFLTYGGKTLWKDKIEKNQWLNILVHFKMSYSSDGFIEAWKDGVKLGRVNGPNSPKSDNCGNPMESPFFKMGIYRSPWKPKHEGKYDTKITERELWIDNLKLGAGSKNPFGGTTPSEDTQAPLAPNTVTATGITQTSLYLSWKNPPENLDVTEYEIFANGKKVKTVPANIHTVQLTNLTPNLNYSIKVRAKDAAGNKSAYSSPETAVTDAEDTNQPPVNTKKPQWSMDKSVTFDGVNDFVDAGKIDIKGQAMTLSARFKTSNLANCASNDCRIISKAVGVSEQDHYFMISTVKVGDKTRLRFRLKTNGETSTLIATSGDLSNNTWAHVTAVYDGKTMRLFKDGKQVGSRTKSGKITSNSKVSVWVGGSPSGASSRPWKGEINDVQMYSRALSSAEIAKLAGSNPRIPDPVLPRAYTVEYKADNGGKIVGSAKQTIVKGKSTTAITAVANKGYTFVKWSDGLKTAKRTDKATSNLSFIAKFSKIVVEPPVTIKPKATTLIGPTGNTTDTTPTYSWKAVSGAEWYYLWSRDNKGDISNKWYHTSKLNCESGTCSTTPSTALPLGSVRWYVISWNKSGLSPWSKGMLFSVTDPKDPTNIVPDSPENLSEKAPTMPGAPEEATTDTSLETSDKASGGSFGFLLLPLALMGLRRRMMATKK